MILVTGASGQLGTAFRQNLGTAAEYLDRSMMDLSAPGRPGAVIRARAPELVINCAAYTAVDRAEDEKSLAIAINGHAVGEMAKACRDIGARFVTFSTDYVFDGEKPAPYVESDPPAPINAYGYSKLVGEELACQANHESLIVRTSWVLSATHPNFASTMIRLASDRDLTVVDDQFGRPTMADDLAHATLEAVQADVVGVLHLANRGVTTWYGLAKEVLALAGGDPERIHPCDSRMYPTPARRPKNSVLESERARDLGLTPLPDYRVGLERVVPSIVGELGK